MWLLLGTVSVSSVGRLRAGVDSEQGGREAMARSLGGRGNWRGAGLGGRGRVQGPIDGHGQPETPSPSADRWPEGVFVDGNVLLNSSPLCPALAFLRFPSFHLSSFIYSIFLVYVSHVIYNDNKESHLIIRILQGQECSGEDTWRKDCFSVSFRVSRRAQFTRTVTTMITA